MARIIGTFDLVELMGGERLYTHTPNACKDDETCSVHKPSNHCMVEFRQHWRNDRALMERICPCGVGHPDPDDLSFKRKSKGEEFAHYESIHGCCPKRCCDGFANPA